RLAAARGTDDRDELAVVRDVLDREVDVLECRELRRLSLVEGLADALELDHRRQRAHAFCSRYGNRKRPTPAPSGWVKTATPTITASPSKMCPRAPRRCEVMMMPPSPRPTSTI